VRKCLDQRLPPLPVALALASDLMRSSQQQFLLLSRHDGVASETALFLQGATQNSRRLNTSVAGPAQPPSEIARHMIVIQIRSPEALTDLTVGHGFPAAFRRWRTLRNAFRLQLLHWYKRRRVLSMIARLF
jgi:hypothetical protein